MVMQPTRPLWHPDKADLIDEAIGAKETVTTDSGNKAVDANDANETKEAIFLHGQ
jgi:hypothetical protein